MDLDGIEHTMARLDADYRTVATKPVDDTDADALRNVGATIEEGLTRLAVDGQAGYGKRGGG